MDIQGGRHVRTRLSAAEVAFGGSPGVAVASAASVVGQWQRAVALAAQGHYARARAQLDGVRGADAALSSLLLSTRASWLRQQGWHALAAELDGAALGLALALPREKLGFEALCDALTGLAADAIGQWRLAVTNRHLDRLRGLLGAESGIEFWRQRVRLDWVSAESELAGGDPLTALAFAQSALARSRAVGSVRHEIKSQLLVAAAYAGLSNLDRAVIDATEVLRRCVEHGLLPLEWAASMLLAGVTAGGKGSDRVTACAAELGVRGARFRDPTP